MKIQVTEEDIKNGKRESGEFCPIALAVKRQLGRECYVFSDAIELVTPENTAPRKLLYLPMEGEAFIASFDNNFRVEPFSFELEDLMNPLINTGEPYEQADQDNGHSGG